MTARAEALRKHELRLAKRRDAERDCATDFLVNGADGHAEQCIYALEGGEPCSRRYDPPAFPDTTPWPIRMYEGTGIGALYGLPDSERHLWQLAGWEVVIPVLGGEF